MRQRLGDRLMEALFCSCDGGPFPFRVRCKTEPYRNLRRSRPQVNSELVPSWLYSCIHLQWEWMPVNDTGEHHCINVIMGGYDKHVISRDPVCLFSRFIDAAQLHGRIGAAREG